MNDPIHTFSNTTRAMADTDQPLRCPCGSDEELPLSQEGKRAWVQCESCIAWQHPICVGLLDDENHMPEHYYCEECKPEHHKRFQIGSDSDNRADIAKERQEMFVTPRLRDDAERRRRRSG